MDQYNIIYRKKNNSWQYIISYKDADGKWKQKSKQGFEESKVGKILCKEAAEKALEELKSMAKIAPTPKELEGIIFKDFSEMFLKHQKLYIEQNTLTLYKSSINSFNLLDNLPMAKISPLNIQECTDELIKAKLKQATIKIYLTKIKILFEYAIKMSVIPLSPVENIKINKDKTQKTKIALTKAELEMLLNQIKNQKFYVMSLLASKCGLRIGEILGLSWLDIDFESKTIHVNKQWKHLKDKRFGLGELKSKNSNREVPMPAIVINQLKKYDKKYPRNIDNRLFKNTDTSTAGRSLSNTYRKLGFNISVHELRHTYATTLIANGLDFKTVAELMGHDVEQTIKTYSHVTNDMRKNAIKLIDKIL